VYRLLAHWHSCIGGKLLWSLDSIHTRFYSRLLHFPARWRSSNNGKVWTAGNCTVDFYPKVNIRQTIKLCKLVIACVDSWVYNSRNNWFYRST